MGNNQPIKLTFTKWKDLSSIFYTKGIYRVTVYENDTIEIINPIGIKMMLDIVSTHQQGNRLAFAVLHHEHRTPGSIILHKNTLILLWERMNGIKLKL